MCFLLVGNSILHNWGEKIGTKLKNNCECFKSYAFLLPEMFLKLVKPFIYFESISPASLLLFIVQENQAFSLGWVKCSEKAKTGNGWGKLNFNVAVNSKSNWGIFLQGLFIVTSAGVFLSLFKYFYSSFL